MPRACTVCRHPGKEQVDIDLVAGKSFRHIASRYGLSTGALQRHKRRHIPAALAKAQRAEEVAQADDLLAEMRKLQRVTLSILGRAAHAGELRTALAAIREARGNVELLGKLAGELQDGVTVNVVLSPQWVSLRTCILLALDPYPQAKMAVAVALKDGHAGG